MSLNEQILAQVQQSGLVDFDQRSALGMARSWLDNGKLDTWNPERHKDMIQYPKRDQLATELVEIMEGVDETAEVCVVALQEARRVINEPFLDPTMNGQKSRAAKLKPADAKKAKG